ncbi:MAG: 2-C-methyl-D-erythritol 2,4-cyclodiphosphate synthase, partial [Acidimicrobiales bacterium]
MRIGQGFDVHAFTDDPDRPLILGGVVVPGRGLAGHSDADVAAHAVADALLGAAGLGDMGRHFPDTDDRWKDASSLELLAAVVTMVRDAGWALANVDLTLITEIPLLAPHVPAMVERLGGVLGAPVSVKAKRAEGLGAIGRREG